MKSKWLVIAKIEAAVIKRRIKEGRKEGRKERRIIGREGFSIDRFKDIGATCFLATSRKRRVSGCIAAICLEAGHDCDAPPSPEHLKFVGKVSGGNFSCRVYMQDNVAEQGVWKLRQRRKDSFPTSSLERERGGEGKRERERARSSEMWNIGNELAFVEQWVPRSEY